MNVGRYTAYMNLWLTCIFSICSVLGTILLPSFLPDPLPDIESSHNENDTTEIKESQSPTAPVDLLFVGDIMMARGVEWRIGKTNLDYPLLNISDFLSTADLTIGNFEGTIRENSVQELDGFTFDTSPEIAKTLVNAGIDVLSLSNNHSNNYGETITKFTRETITDLGMTPFGDPYDSKNFIARKTINGLTISFIGFHAFTEEPESILSSITAEKEAGNFVIILPHWGNEYEPTPSSAQIEAAHIFIDAGADAIIGSHPHVIQTYENYSGVPIFYSLGNFLFDQTWSTPTQQGLAVLFTIDSKNITMSLTPIDIGKQQPIIMDDAKALQILSDHNLPLALTIAR